MSDEQVYFDKPFENYWYDKQLVSYIEQFMAVFSDMYVSIGKNDFNSQTNLIQIPIRYGGADRVVDAVIAGNTTNKPLRLPMFSAKLVDLAPAPERQKGLGTVERRAVVPRGGRLEDIVVPHRLTPMPYKLAFELNIFTSNESQKFQILEQILTLFNPSIQIQTSDDPFDGAKITVLERENIGFEENYPSGTDRKLNVCSIIFSTYGWLQAPIDFKKNFVETIHVRLQTLRQNQSFSDAIDADINDPPKDSFVIDGGVVKDIPFDDVE
jgi:hypothetical protein